MIRNALIVVTMCSVSFLPVVVAHADDAGAKPAGAAHKTGEYISDSALTAKVKAKLLAEKNLKSLPISVESTDGVVTLSGHVMSTAQIDQAVDVTRHIKGVKDVHNTLELKTEKPEK